VSAGTQLVETFALHCAWIFFWCPSSITLLAGYVLKLFPPSVGFFCWFLNAARMNLFPEDLSTPEMLKLSVCVTL